MCILYVHLNDTISSHTLRVENCPKRLDATNALLSLFGRYDLRLDQPVVEWKARREGRPVHGVYLVHFRDAAWARAALRERQGASLSRFFPAPLRLIPYPPQRQIG